MKRFEIYDSQDHITQEALNAVPLIGPGAVLIVVRSGILARILPVAINQVSVAINQDMKALMPKRDSGLNSEFLAYHLFVTQKAILKDVKLGTTVHSIVSEILFNFPIPLPPLNIQHSLVAQMQTAQAKARALQAQAVQLRQSARREFVAALTLDVE